MLSQKQNKEVEKCIFKKKKLRQLIVENEVILTMSSPRQEFQAASRKPANMQRLQQLDASSVSCTAVFPVTDSVVLLYTTRCKFCTRVISHFFSFLLLVCSFFVVVVVFWGGLFLFCFCQRVICHNRGKSMPR